MHASTIQLLCCVALLLFSPSHGFVFPGVDMVNYEPGEEVVLKVNKLTSVHTQLPYPYYSLPFCQPKKLNDKHENLGEIIRGDRIEDSAYEVFAGKDIECRAINYLDNTDQKHECTEYTKDDISKFREKVKQEYAVQWVLDNLPAAISHHRDGKGGKRYEIGFPLGLKCTDKEGDYCLHNHVDITVVYSKSHADVSAINVVGFEVAPKSVNYDVAAWKKKPETERKNCPGDHNALGQLVLSDGDKQEIAWTYSLKWVENNDIPWAKRWDVYLANTDAQIHWFSIINSLMIVLFLTGMVAMILLRTLRADLRTYQASLEQQDEEGETGWKLVHGDVFRPPAHPMALAVLIGSGVQVFGMTLITMMFTVLGFLSPAQRGYLILAFVVLFVFAGVFAGYFSTRCYKAFRGVHWKKNTIMTAISFPGIVFAIFFVLNMFERAKRSSGAVPVSTLFSIIALWLGISVPLVFFGSYFGFRKPLPEDPVRTNQIPRQIPEQVWYMSPVLSILMGGILPFGAVFIELFFILSAVWGNQLYYIFGFLFIVFGILIITCAEITVVMCYFQLCAEDYNWWWRSFLTSGASALYLFLYSIFYFATTLEIETFVSTVLYFGYTIIMSIAFFVLTGMIGFYACYFFVRKIYSSIHVD